MRQWLVNKLPILDAARRDRKHRDRCARYRRAQARPNSRCARPRMRPRARCGTLRETQNSLIEAEKLAALGRLVAGVAHEVNNPVGISLTVASALERKTVELYGPSRARRTAALQPQRFPRTPARDASAQLVANLNRAAELIQSFKQVAADRNYSDQRSFDLGDLTEQVVMSLRPGLRKHNLTLNVECQPNLIMNCYPGTLRAGAHQSVPQCGGACVPGRQARRRSISRCGPPASDNVEIIFSDNGIGMSLDVRRRAFDPFFTTRRDQGGTGLGLHIVYSIVTTRAGRPARSRSHSRAAARASR